MYSASTRLLFIHLFKSIFSLLMFFDQGVWSLDYQRIIFFFSPLSAEVLGVE